MNKWYLIIGEEESNVDFSIWRKYPLGSIVYLKNNTLQLICGNDEHKFVYEIDLDRDNINDWVMHISRKNWATDDMLQGIYNAVSLLKHYGICGDEVKWCDRESNLKPFYFDENDVDVDNVYNADLIKTLKKQAYDKSEIRFKFARTCGKFIEKVFASPSTYGLTEKHVLIGRCWMRIIGSHESIANYINKISGGTAAIDSGDNKEQGE